VDGPSGGLGRGRNGDGFIDIVAAARYYDAGQTDEGRVFVFHEPWPEVYLPVTLRDWP
jgi:hypothetical protein